MNEEKSYIPTLTLEPTAEAVAEAAAPAEEEVKKDIPIERPELEKLSPAVRPRSRPLRKRSTF